MDRAAQSLGVTLKGVDGAAVAPDVPACLRPLGRDCSPGILAAPFFSQFCGRVWAKKKRTGGLVNHRQLRTCFIRLVVSGPRRRRHQLKTSAQVVVAARETKRQPVSTQTLCAYLWCVPQQYTWKGVFKETTHVCACIRTIRESLVNRSRTSSGRRACVEQFLFMGGRDYPCITSHHLWSPSGRKTYTWPVEKPNRRLVATRT